MLNFSVFEKFHEFLKDRNIPEYDYNMTQLIRSINNKDDISCFCIYITDIFKVSPVCVSKYLKIIRIFLFNNYGDSFVFNYKTALTSLYYFLVHIGLLDFSDYDHFQCLNQLMLIKKDDMTDDISFINRQYQLRSKDNKFYRLLEDISVTGKEINLSNKNEYDSLLYLPIFEVYAPYFRLEKPYCKFIFLYSFCSVKVIEKYFNKLSLDEKVITCYILDSKYLYNKITYFELDCRYINMYCFTQACSIYDLSKLENYSSWYLFSIINFNIRLLSMIKDCETGNENKTLTEEALNEMQMNMSYIQKFVLHKYDNINVRVMVGENFELFMDLIKVFSVFKFTIKQVDTDGIVRSNIFQVKDKSVSYIMDLSFTSLSNIMKRMEYVSFYKFFAYCQNIKVLKFLPNFDTSNVVDMSYMFCWCTSLDTLDIRAFNTSKVTDMSYMFARCSGLYKIDLSEFNTSNVKTMKSMFSRCCNIAYLNLSYFDTSNVIDMSYMFKECLKLQTVDLNSFNTSSVTNMCEMFFKCVSIQTVDLISFNTPNVLDMSYMFGECTNLENVDFSSFNTSKVTNMNYMFCKCPNLSVVDLSSFNTENLITMCGMFSQCHNLRQVNLSSFNTLNVITLRRMFYDCSALKTVSLSSFNTSNVTTMKGLFHKCTSLTEAELTSFDTSKVTNMSDMFSECVSLTSVNITTFDTSNVKDMSYMFNGCSNLHNIDLSSFNTSNVVDMSWMFCNCHNLRSIDISKIDTSNVVKMNSMFKLCKSFEIVDFTTIDTRKVKDIGELFSRCPNLMVICLSDRTKNQKFIDQCIIDKIKIIFK